MHPSAGYRIPLTCMHALSRATVATSGLHVLAMYMARTQLGTRLLSHTNV